MGKEGLLLQQAPENAYSLGTEHKVGEFGEGQRKQTLLGTAFMAKVLCRGREGLETTSPSS